MSRDKVKQLESADITAGGAIAPLPPETEPWILYFKTDVKVSGATKAYSFKLFDQKGLSSNEVNVETSKNKLPPVKLYHGNNPITAASENDAQAITDGSSASRILQARTETGAVITGTLEKKNGSGWSPVSTVSGTTTAAVNLPALESSENEVIYKITLKARAEGYDDSESKAFFIKLTRKIIVRFSVQGETGCGSLKGTYGLDDETATVNDPKEFIVAPNSTVSFTAQAAEGYEIEKWTVNGVQASGTSQTYQLTGITESKTVILSLKKKTYTVNYSVDGGTNGHGTIQAGSDGFVTSGSTLVEHGQSVIFTAKPDEGYEVEKWELNNSTVGGTALTYTLNNVTGPKTVQVKFKKKTYMVTFKVDGGNGSLEGEYGGSLQTAGNSPLQFTVPHGGSVNFTATPTNASQYKVGVWTCTPITGFTGQNGQANASLTVTANTEVSVQFVPLNALVLQTLTIHGKNADSTGSFTLPYNISSVQQSDIQLSFTGHTGIPFTISPSPLTLTPGAAQSLTINVAASPGNYSEWSKTVSITRSKNNFAKLERFNLNGETKTAPFASEYIAASAAAQIDGFVFSSGSDGAVASVSPEGSVTIPAGTGQSFTITVKAQDGSIKQTVNFTVKRQTYTVNYSVDGGTNGHGTIQAGSDGFVTSGSTQVEHGQSVTFTAKPDTGYEVESWTSATASPSNNTTASLSNVNGSASVKVKFKRMAVTINAGTNAWKNLKAAVQAAQNGDTIIINGEIKATKVYGNSGEILINKDLTIEGKTDKTTNILNANSKHTGSTPGDAPATPHRIFKVVSGKKLTLKNLTLKNGKTKDNEGCGGAIFVQDGSIDIMECNFENNFAYGKNVDAKGGAISIEKASEAKITKASFTENAGGDDDDTGVYGGAIYVKDAHLILDTCSFSKNECDGLASYYSHNVYKAVSSSPNDKITLKGTYETDRLNSGEALHNGHFIYLEKGSHIFIDSDFDAPFDVHVALKIAADEFSLGNTVVKGSINGNHNKFLVIDKTNVNITYRINAQGQLYKP